MIMTNSDHINADNYGELWREEALLQLYPNIGELWREESLINREGE